MKFTYNSKDDFSRELLIKYAYLYEIGRIMLEEKNRPNDFKQYKIPLEKVELAVNEAHPDFTKPEIDAYVSNLAIEGYLKILSDKADKSEMYHLIEPKGLSAITSGEFLKQFEARQRDLLQVQLIHSTKSTNRWIVIFTAATVLVGLAGLLKDCGCKKQSDSQSLKIESPQQAIPTTHTDTFPLKEDSSIQNTKIDTPIPVPANKP